MKEQFRISIAAWSWHRMFYDGKITQEDQPRMAREAGAAGLELVNSFFPSPQYDYLKKLKQIADDEGIRILLIMCDDEGSMYSMDFKERRQAIINHRKWLDIAAVLQCHSIRCNVGYEEIDPEEALKNAADNFYELCGYARQYNLNVLIENHGGLSSNPNWLVRLMDLVSVDNFGTLPDFGNFPETTNHYDAVKKMMPYAKAVSAKCHDFDSESNEIHTDFGRMLEIVFEAGYHGYIGVEYEGERLRELDGVKSCMNLLKRYQVNF